MHVCFKFHTLCNACTCSTCYLRLHISVIRMSHKERMGERPTAWGMLLSAHPHLPCFSIHVSFCCHFCSSDLLDFHITAAWEYCSLPILKMISFLPFWILVVFPPPSLSSTCPYSCCFLYNSRKEPAPTRSAAWMLILRHHLPQWKQPDGTELLYSANHKIVRLCAFYRHVLHATMVMCVLNPHEDNTHVYNTCILCST